MKVPAIEMQAKIIDYYRSNPFPTSEDFLKIHLEVPWTDFQDALEYLIQTHALMMTFDYPRGFNVYSVFEGETVYDDNALDRARKVLDLLKADPVGLTVDEISSKVPELKPNTVMMQDIIRLLTYIDIIRCRNDTYYYHGRENGE